jgi:membrane-bound serine protease (ClpP class)
MNPLAWSILLMLLGLALIVLEVFLPSSGIIGFLSIASLLASIILAFYQCGPVVGVAFLAAAAVAVPSALVLAFRYWPSTPMGRRLLLDIPKSEEVLPDTPLRRKLRQLVGKVGTAKSLMLPSGAIVVDGLTFDALSEGMAIEAGQRVRVVEVRGNRVLVRPAEENEKAEPANPDDVLSQPIESLGLDPFEDPLA